MTGAGVKVTTQKFFDDWLLSVSRVSRSSAGTFAGMAIVIEKLLGNYDLGNPAIFTEGGGRIAGHNRDAATKIAHKHDKRIVINSIGGRTSPGPAQGAHKFLRQLKPLALDALSTEDRFNFLFECQRLCVVRLAELQNQQKFQFTFSLLKPLQVAIGRLINESKRESDHVAALAQHLVGAKLEVRFKNDLTSEQFRKNRDCYSAVDTSKAGDLEMGDHVFHVSISPNSGHIQKCVKNLGDFKHPIMLVPESKKTAANALAHDNEDARGKVDIRGIEAFVSQNIDELGKFESDKIRAELVKLLNAYNDRIDNSEKGRPYLKIESPLLPQAVIEDESDDEAE